MNTTNSWDGNRDWIVDLLRVAGSRAIAAWPPDSSSPKGQGDIVTSVDISIENWLVKEIRAVTPDWGIVAEESSLGLEEIGQGFWWVLDPLDGTVNYASGIPCFSLSLALLEDGMPVMGVVVDPIHGEVFEAVKGDGARLNGREIAAQAGPGHVSMIALSSGFLKRVGEMDGRTASMLIARHYPKIRNLGSQALHLCYVACGRFAAAASVEARLWDDAAGALIATEAGARYTDLAGRPVFPVRTPNGRLESLAGRQGDHDQILAIVSENQLKSGVDH